MTMSQSVAGLLLIAYVRLEQQELSEAIRVIDQTIGQLTEGPVSVEAHEIAEKLVPISESIEEGEVDYASGLLAGTVRELGGGTMLKRLMARREMA